jgi:hypothetical protein
MGVKRREAVVVDEARVAKKVDDNISKLCLFKLYNIGYIIAKQFLLGRTIYAYVYICVYVRACGHM